MFLFFSLRSVQISLHRGPSSSAELNMEHCQKGDWSSTRHMAVRCEDVGALTRLAYTWVQMFDIEKRIPMSVTLTEPGLDGVFRIPVESDMSPGT